MIDMVVPTGDVALVVYGAVGGAGLAALDAASISRIAVEATRKRLGVSALAVYDQDAFVAVEERARRDVQEANDGE